MINVNMTWFWYCINILRHDIDLKINVIIEWLIESSNVVDHYVICMLRSSVAAHVEVRCWNVQKDKLHDR
jgi:hypothetical protein